MKKGKQDSTEIRATSEPFIREQVDVYKRKTQIDLNLVKNDVGQKGTELLAKLNQLVARSFAEEDPRYIKAAIGFDPLRFDLGKTIQQIRDDGEVKARLIAGTIPFLPAYRPMMQQCLAKAADVDIEQLRAREPLEYDQDMVTDVGMQISTDGGIDCRSVDINKVDITIPAPTVTKQIPLRRAEWFKWLGMEAFNVRQKLQDSFGMTIDGTFLDGAIAAVPNGVAKNDNIEKFLGSIPNHIVVDTTGGDGGGINLQKVFQTARLLDYKEQIPIYSSPVDKWLVEDRFITDLQNLGKKYWSEASAEAYFQDLISGKLLGDADSKSNSGMPIMKNRLRRTVAVSDTTPENHLVLGPPDRVGFWCYVSEGGRTSYLEVSGFGQGLRWFENASAWAGSRVVQFIANPYAMALYQLQKRSTDY